MNPHIIGRYEGEENGPLIIALGGIHGNEHAGPEAIKEVLKLLEMEKSRFPEFQYHGAFLGVVGNLEALRQKKRFIDRDLNRMLTLDEIEQLRRQPEVSRLHEESECLELIDLLEEEISNHGPQLVLLLDLHTTTATGGVFSIAADDEISLGLAKSLHVPVILGIASGLKGTTIDYFNRPDKNTYCVVFEAGQHDDPDSVLRTVSAIINCMRSLASVDPAHVDHRHDEILIDLAEGLPKVTRLIHHHKIHPGENFIMNPGFQNFDQVEEGQVIAQNDGKPVASPVRGLILMPKYQPLGDDGFFIVKEES